MNSAPLLSIQNLSIDFLSENGNTSAVKNISLSVHRGEIVALVGESGSGKSVTSLSVLQLLPKPPAHYPEGKIIFTEKGQSIDLLQLPQKELQRIRGAKISMIFQEPMTSLNPVLKCGEQVMEALLVHKKISNAEAKRQTIEWFEKVKLPEPKKIFNRYPHQLSGGQKQRVMIAMAMCCNPDLLICDEPTTALDVTVQKTILQLIKELQQARNMGVIFITHDLGVVAEIADRVAIMYKGELVEEGSTQTIFRNAFHPYTKALIACRPALHPKGERLPTVSDYLSEGKAELERSKFEASARNTEHQTANLRQCIVQVQNLTVKFPAKTSLFGKPLRFFTAVNNVSFDVFKNETLGLVGESGCGKTTLGRSLLRLVEPSSGKIIYNGTDITQLSKEQTKALRKNVQLVFQDPYSSLNPRLTIESALAEPMAVAGIETSAKARRKRATELLEKVSLPASALNRYPHEFSGGQRQRIVIARALGLNPDFLVCDESVSALDVSVQAQVLNLLNDLKKELGLTLLFISHDLSVVRYMCDRVLVMQAGNIVESGLAEEVYNHPKNSYTQALLNAVPQINP
ncbi:ABC transporter ATP-binding protein [Flavisolibacter ginsenosidimutans]|uniref:ABC transporter ATP-binding protein n=1 Tax=Flavisolibacter ginsenosidimutans TaxID=661481 RepID=A0A5B8UG93_9BACT|nr:ABC transporter ATP-binding protein [Flavisolibacter ginsenosidimutans]QEC55375.1 ABC transporter ATP-binding protein [Flavisolibacter ginsenosidimutans]